MPLFLKVFTHHQKKLLLMAVYAAMGLSAVPAAAASLRDKIMERRQEKQEQKVAQNAKSDGGQNEMSDADTTNTSVAGLPPGTRVLRDIAYGSDQRQTVDVYLPAAVIAHPGMPVIVMVHGGAWKVGNKTARGVVENKAAHWLPKAYVFIAINYRMLPDTKPLEQADDVARALAMAQGRAAEWGGSRSKFILMGHSAGAHLVSVLASNPAIASKAGAGPWLATISLDSAAYNIKQIMEQKHYRFYDDAFGSDPAYWQAVSPSLLLKQAAAPFLAVCSSQRPDKPCLQAEAFVSKAKSLGMLAQTLPQGLSHADINKNLGLENAYTAAVDKFLKEVDSSLP
ncbi:alpha/beta hydrolase [Undibacterium sp. Di26W]|uniref:alpha/beta hydrolase n=1 Tax=Undibacterium sp. Di26W TaxID=3413035 RepID=UPI003BF25288